MPAGQYRDMSRRNNLIAAGILVALALISFFVAGTFAKDPANFSGIIRALDEKAETVTALTGAAAASSAAIPLRPPSSMPA